MKTQQQHKTLEANKTLFGVEKMARQMRSNANVMAFDQETSFDSHWSYTYIIDYIWAHKKVKKRKA
ncbi:MAG TPA: hypothetical protein VN698_10210 [Bacteroidia bacterium]|nr:hypothetical protein [Bacteroidia bacterium]